MLSALDALCAFEHAFGTLPAYPDTVRVQPMLGSLRVSGKIQGEIRILHFKNESFTSNGLKFNLTDLQWEI